MAGEFSLNDGQKLELNRITENGSKNFANGYDYVRGEMKKYLDSSSDLTEAEKKSLNDTSYWLEKAAEINRNDGDSEANVFIRGVTRSGLSFDQKAAGDEIIQSNSDLIGTTVFRDIFQSGKVPSLQNLLAVDVNSALGIGGQTLGGWGGAFYYWDMPLSDRPNDTVGNRISGSPAEYEKFIAITANAVVETMTRLGMSVEQFLTAYYAQAPDGVKAQIANRVVEYRNGEIDTIMGDPNRIDGYAASFSPTGEVSWYTLDKNLNQITLTDSGKIADLNERRRVRLDREGDSSWQGLPADLVKNIEINRKASEEAKRIAAEKAAAEKAAAEKAAAEKAAAEKAAAEKAAAEKAAAEKAERDRLAGIEALRQAELQRQKAIEDRARRERELREVQERQKAMQEKAQREMEEQRRQREAEQAKRAAEQERLRQEAANIRIPGSGNTTRPAPGVPTPRPRPVVSPPRGGGRGPFIGFPVVLDLNGDGRLDIVQLDENAPAFGKSEFDGTAKESVGPTFDWDGDGVREQTAWVGPQDGLLAIDLPSDGRSGPDGKIDQPEEIAFALWKTEEERQAELKELGIDDTGRPVTDIEGLRFAFDTNRDNVLDQNDARWGEFRIWQDINQNGISDEGELLTMEQAGIKLINLLPTEHGSKTFADGSTILGTTGAQLKDGTTMLVGDVALSYKVL
ncbi:ATPase involved in DNA repair [Agrobacterium sp. DSM 25558]|uniref:hypothetical protein n=1 Tax=Agrobacterium sp. DSM 25558 TaxID=1907665 RepID=UPI0009724AF3|nr:hypothetical protein [Agrobacterium sp. DSM 25558]SCX03917.1 ATPase involved in DNA repair [Agrobacterium sp. DSM 25558]